MRQENNHISKPTGLREVHDISKYPAKDQTRKMTDLLCTIIGLAFTGILVIAACFLFNYDHYVKAGFPSDSQGRVCGYDLKNHAYIYFTNFPRIDQRVCVNSCPTSNATRLLCVPTDDIGCNFNADPKFYVSYYDNQPQSTEIGSFCVPTDEEVKLKMYADIDVTDRYNFFTDVKSITVCCFIALGISMVFCVLVQLFPQRMNRGAILVGLLVTVVMMIFVAVYPEGHIGERLLFVLLLLLLFVPTVISILKFRSSEKYYEIYLRYSTLMVLNGNLVVLLYIPIFTAILVLFLLIIVFEVRSFWSSASLNFDRNQVYYTLAPGATTTWTTIVVIQALWGLSFIKQSFNFCISGNAVRWYFKDTQNAQDLRWHTPLKLLVTTHFGSVVAGSFMNLFSIFDFIFDILRPSESSTWQCYKSFYASVLKCFGEFFNLIRSDTMAYINIAGNPYCNSSRYCELICGDAVWTKDSQSIGRSYRICAHFMLAGITSLINFLLQDKQTSLFIVLVVFILSLFISTLWISLHADATEAIQICLLFDEELTTIKYEHQIGRNLANVFGRMTLQKGLVEEIELQYRGMTRIEGSQ